jgi:hypothetical protein
LRLVFNVKQLNRYKGSGGNENIHTEHNKEYLLHVQAVLRLIGQKRLDKQCKKLQKGIKDSNVVLSALKQKSIGP